MTELRKINLYDANDNPILLESNGALPVNLQDQTSTVIDLHLSELIQSISIAVNTAIDDNVVEIACDMSV